MFNKIKALLNIGTKQKGFINRPSAPHARMGGLLSFGDGAYDNIFADVSRIAEQFATVLPYAIDKKGEMLRPQPQLVSALYMPNKEMSGPQFFEALATMLLVHPTVYLLCWHAENGKAVPGGPITADNICSFTFLENPTVKVLPDNSIVYRTRGQEYSEKEVIALSLNVNPYRILDGYSPTEAAKKWATLDDYIVDWQQGFFRNNAIPAGEFVITADTPEKFNKIVDKMEERHKGAGRNNNVFYVHRPVSDVDGKPVNAQIEWVPFSSNSSDIKLDQVFAQANKKTSMAFGVPEEVKGHLQNSNYRSVTTAVHVFEKYAVLPKLTKVWSMFTHEMNRITGGLGFAITFDYEPSPLADEEKVRAETLKTQFTTLSLAISAGYDLASAVDALGLPEDFKLLKEKPQSAELPEISDAKPSDASQIETSLKQTKSVESHGIKKKAPEDDDDELKLLLEGYTEEQIEAFINGEDFDAKEKSRSLAEKLLPILLVGALAYALSKEKELETQARVAGYEIDKEFEYEIGEDFKSSYLKYLEDITFSFTNDTDAALHKVFERAETEGLTELETNEALRDVLNDDMWRIQRLQDTEAHRSSELASLDMAKKVAKHNEIEGVLKVWKLNPESLNHCELCKALDGVEIPLDESFEDYARDNELGEFHAGEGEVADGHPHCHCFIVYKVPEKEVEPAKIVCPKCKRYVCEAKNADLNNVVCARCGEKFPVKIVNGKIAKGGK